MNNKKNVLTERQEQVFKWIKDDLQLPVYADVYKGALCLLYHKPSGYITFVAHMGRDIMNGLAYEVKDIKREQVQYVTLVNEFQNEWKDEWKDLSKNQNKNDLIQKSELEINGIKEHLIPSEVCDKIHDLVQEHKKGRDRSEKANELFFTTFLHYEDKERIPKNFFIEWKKAKEYFLSHAHLRKKDFSENTLIEIEEHFKNLNKFLHIASIGEYKRKLENLNEILAATNE